MKSTENVSPRRKLARLAVAGAIAAIPLAALAVPASADITVEPEITEVNRPHHDNNPWNDRNPWDNLNPWTNNRHHDHDRWDDDCDYRDRDRNPFRNVIPRGAFGSS